MSKKIVKKIEETVVETVAEVKEEANETVGAVTFKRWQVFGIAAAVALALIVIIL
jgi:ElaB/YqjD/DUF883 family membrane-anchored ribosome-binding protein